MEPRKYGTNRGYERIAPPPAARLPRESGAVNGAACRRCGAPLEGQFTRGALMACSAPPRIYWRGEHLRFSPMQARIMVMLVQFGSASFEDLAALSKVGSLRAVFVAATAIRRRLPAEVQIVTHRRWGYALEQGR